MGGLDLSAAGWIILAVLVVALLVFVARYFASVAVELARVLLVAGGVLVVVFVVWLLLR